MRHQPGLVARSCHSAGSMPAGSSEESRKPLQPRRLRQHLAGDLAQGGPVRQVGAVTNDVDPGQHDFVRAGRHQGAHLLHDGIRGHAAAGAAAETG